jgi:predicted acylesterase/phospholipase RssA
VAARQLPDGSHQLRLALVLNGGVSLAIYMYGVTKELHNLARASAALDAGAGRPSGVTGVYYDFLQAEAKKSPPISVVIDLIAGTSAGGINGVVLAKALATDLSIDPLKSVWFNEGDIGKLILPDTSQVAAPRWWKRAWGAVSHELEPLIAAGNALFDLATNHAPLHGDHMSRWIFDALAAMDTQPLNPRLALLPEGETLELLVTTTDMKGYERDIVDPETGLLPPDTTFRQVFSFLHHADDDASRVAGLRLAAGPDVNARLAFGARSTSSFPGAFPPVSIESFTKELQGPPGFDAASFIASFADSGFPAYRAAGADPKSTEFIDGGVLDNTPFDVVIKSIAGKESVTQVTRHIIYVQPVPPDQPPTAEVRAKHQQYSQRTGIVGTLYHALVAIPRRTSMLADLLRLQNLNVSITTVGKLLGLLDEKADQDSATQDGASATDDLVYADLREIDERRDVVRAICRRLRFPDDSNPVVTIEEKLAAYSFSGGNFAFERRRRQVALQAVNQQLRTETDVPIRQQLAQVKKLLYTSLDSLQAALDTALVSVPALAAGDPVSTPESDAVLTSWRNPDRLADSVWQAIATEAGNASTNIEAPAALVADITKVFGSGEESIGAGGQASRDKIVARLQRFPSYDSETLLVTSLAGLPQLSPIRATRFSPRDVKTVNPGHRLKGLRLGHFGGFFDKRWRKEDYLWGRLTAAEQVVRLIGSLNYPEGPDEPPAPPVQSAIRDALREVFAEEPDLAGLNGEDIDAARAIANGSDTANTDT